MKRSLPKLEQLSQTLTSHQTYYKFNKMDEHLSERYRKGRVNAAKWLSEMIYYYIKEESKFINDFKEHIQKQKKELSELKEGDFKQGIYDELNIIEEMIHDRNS